MAGSAHLEKQSVNVICGGCENKFVIFSTSKDKEMRIEKCNMCHPAYTGERKIFSARGIDKFNKKYNLAKTSKK